MHNLTNASLLRSRPDWLGVYAEIITHLGKANNLIQNSAVDHTQIASASPYEIAYLQNRELGVIELICWELMQLGFIQVRNHRLENVTYFSNTSHLEPREQIIFDFLKTPRTVEELRTDKDLQKAIASQCEIYRRALVRQGYIKPERKKYLTAGVSGLLIIGLAFGKPLVGVLASYRYLLLLIGAAMPKASLAIAATAWLGQKSQSAGHLTAKGKEYLASLQENTRNVTPNLLAPPAKPDRETSLLLALHGLAIVNDSEIEAYRDLFNLFSTG